MTKVSYRLPQLKMMNGELQSVLLQYKQGCECKETWKLLHHLHSLPMWGLQNWLKTKTKGFTLLLFFLPRQVPDDVDCQILVVFYAIYCSNTEFLWFTEDEGDLLF